MGKAADIMTVGPTPRRRETAMVMRLRSAGKVYVPGLGLVQKKVKPVRDNSARHERLKRLEAKYELIRQGLITEEVTHVGFDPD